MKRLTEFLTEENYDTVKIPDNTGKNGKLVNMSPQERNTYEEIAKYGDILVDAYIERFGENVGSHYNMRDKNKYYRRIESMIPKDNSVDAFSKYALEQYVYAKLKGVSKEYIIPVTIGMTNGYNRSEGYLIDPISFKSKKIKWNRNGTSEGNVPSWHFIYANFDDVGGWIRELVPYDKAI